MRIIQNSLVFCHERCTVDSGCGDDNPVSRISEKIAGQLRQIGYTFVALDLAGYRMGSLNELIKANKA